MLSEADRQKLTAIESRLRLDDPVFVDRFTATSKRRAQRGRHGTAASVALIAALIAALVAAAVGLVLSSVGTVVIAVTAIGAVAGLWITTGHRPRP